MRISNEPVRAGSIHRCTVSNQYAGPNEPVVDFTLSGGCIVAWLCDSRSRMAYGNIGVYYEVPAHAKLGIYVENIMIWWKS